MLWTKFGRTAVCQYHLFSLKRQVCRVPSYRDVVVVLQRPVRQLCHRPPHRAAPVPMWKRRISSVDARQPPVAAFLVVPCVVSIRGDAKRRPIRQPARDHPLRLRVSRRESLQRVKRCRRNPWVEAPCINVIFFNFSSVRPEPVLGNHRVLVY
jgi:hypothetical protein